MSSSDVRECRNCAAPIFLARCWNGRFIPFNSEPDAHGTYRIDQDVQDGRATGMLVAAYTRSEERDGPMFIQHSCNTSKVTTVRLLATYIRESGMDAPEHIMRAVEQVLDARHSDKIA